MYRTGVCLILGTFLSFIAVDHIWNIFWAISDCLYKLIRSLPVSQLMVVFSCLLSQSYCKDEESSEWEHMAVGQR